MDFTLVYWLFFPLFAMAMAWLVMVWWLYRALAARHPAKYREMGEPQLFSEGEPHVLRLLKFLLSGEADALRDAALSLQVNVMRAWLVVYLVGFGALLVIVFQGFRAVS